MLREARVARADSVRPPQRSTLHRVLLATENRTLLQRIPSLSIYGFRPGFGGIQGGAGTTAGAVYDPAYVPQGWNLLVDGLASTKRYWQARLLLGYDAGRTVFYGFARYRHLPEEGFWGVGPTTSLDNESDYRLDDALVGGLLGYQLSDRANIGVQVGYRNNWPGPGRDPEHPNVDDRYQAGELPGLSSTIRHLVLGGFAEWDGRNPSRPFGSGRRYALVDTRLDGLSFDAKHGFYALAEVSHQIHIDAEDRADEHFSYVLGRVVLQEYAAFRRGMQRIAFQQVAAYSKVTNDRFGAVPFYDLPSLGGSNSLRGFDNLRFRDRGSMMINAEYRWQIWHFTDLVAFVDAGQVFRDVRDIDLDDTAVSYGGGIRFKLGTLHQGHQSFARLEAATGKDGARIIFKYGSFF